MARNHDAYINTAAPELRPLLSHLRAQLARVLPDAEEVMAYKMPGFRLDGTIVAGYAAFTRQCGLYIDPRAIAANTDAIHAAGLKHSKTGITFAPSKPIPDTLVETLALASRRALGH